MKNPPAFPTSGVVIPDQYGNHQQQGACEGMTLRDYLAAHAPISFETAAEVFKDSRVSVTAHGNGVLDVLACLRYQYADAMLAARGVAE